MEGIGPFVNDALQSGVDEGRSGRVIVYVWSAGNGGLDSDDCNFDGFVNDRRSIAVG